jgi:hypothetical protein
MGAVLSQRTRPVAAVRRASTAGYWIALLIGLGGLVGGLAWGLTAYRGLQEEIDGFARLTVPGEAVVPIEASGGQVVYYEGPGSPSLQDLDVRIMGPGGAHVPVDVYDADLRYDAPDQVVGRAIGTFQAATPGRYGIVVGAAPQGSRVAVGGSIASSKLGSIIGALLLVVAAGAAGLVLAVVTGIRRSRR